MEGHSLVLLLLVTSASAKVVKTTVGEDTVLPCEGPEGRVIALQWEMSKRDVLVYRGGRVDKMQDEQFRNRVQLQDPEMKSGNLGVILKNVTLKDTGIYTCEGLIQTSKRQKRAVEGKDITHRIQLSVQSSPKEKDPQEPQRNQDEATPTVSDGAAETRGSHVAAVIVVIVAVALVAGVLYWKRKEIKWQKVEQPHTLAGHPPSDSCPLRQLPP
ncbi:uncharacterized protein [Eucyclogobius newberryi]|uniref:uncharacterized protein n=1 Tax=Eucyclogobius newberryi TaxID=166745 RepID=UPI003B59EC9F